MKSIILLALTIPFVGAHGIRVNTNSKFLSVASKQYEKIFDIKITSQDDHNIHCDEQELLNLNGMFLKHIPNEIRSNAIRHVSLGNNFLKEIPHNILNHVTTLSCFNLSRNNINLYTNNKIQHPYLKVLDLSYQKMSSDVNGMLELETLDGDVIEDIYRDMIFNSTEMKLPNLQYLVLSGNDIATLVRDFSVSFPKLVRLDLININALKLDPYFFDNIPSSLRLLHFENNHLRNLTVQNLAEITALYLDENPLVQLNINSTKLRTLSLFNCMNLNSIILDTPYLEELDLSKNNLNNAIKITFEMLRSIRILLLDHNKLSYIPMLNNMQRLNELSLRYNMIEYIEPNIFGYLMSLTKMSLKGNRINRLERNTFLGLEKLEYLDLSENQLTSLPFDWMIPLEKLRYLNLNSNRFVNFVEMGVHTASLLHLFVRNNTFTKVATEEIRSLPNEITLYLA